MADLEKLMDEIARGENAPLVWVALLEQTAAAATANPARELEDVCRQWLQTARRFRPTFAALDTEWATPSMRAAAIEAPARAATDAADEPTTLPVTDAAVEPATPSPSGVASETITLPAADTPARPAVRLAPDAARP